MVISKESVKYSLNNIKKSKARSILTILSIFVGIATIFIFVSFGWGLYDYIDEFTSSSSADKLLIQPKGGGGVPGLDNTFRLLEDDLGVIENTAGIYEATGIHMGVGEIEQDDSKKYVFIMSYDPDLPMIMELSDIEIVKGRELRDGDSGKVTLGYNYMVRNRIFPKAYAVNSKINVQGVDLRIVGFYESVGNPQDDSNIYITNDFADDILREVGSDEELAYGMIIARAEKDKVDEVGERVEKKLRQARDLDEGKEDFSVQSYSDLLESFTVVLDIIIGFIILIAFISVIVSAVNTANTMITSVLERFKEIGVLKSIGARNSEIFKIFLFESGFLGFVAGTIGVLAGWAATDFGAVILDDLGYGFLSPHYSWHLFGGLILFATLTGAVSGMIPAWRASRINAVDALRYE
ncbi:ABC transporter permease [archaeon]|jgi:putative ABC transport system permease protein|nr:ABC transporter permease [archaeon]MBT7128958.1 ABC transporter permease [archaeon]